MHRDWYDVGLEMRRQVHGDAYVDRVLEEMDAFSRDFQWLITEIALGSARLYPQRTARNAAAELHLCGHPGALRFFANKFSYDYPTLFAAVVLTLLPSIVVYVLLQEQIQESLAAGAVKG